MSETLIPKPGRTIKPPPPICPEHNVVMYVGRTKRDPNNRTYQFCYCPVLGCDHSKQIAKK